MSDTDVKEYRRRVAELEDENQRLREWKAATERMRWPEEAHRLQAALSFTKANLADVARDCERAEAERDQLRGDVELLTGRAEAAEDAENRLRAERRVILRRLDDGLSILGPLQDAIESECDPQDGICHEHDLWGDECALAADLRRLRAALAPAAEEPTTESGGAAAIAAERQRQTEREAWTPEHDRHHEPWELVDAALAYVESARPIRRGASYRLPQNLWPWEVDGFKPTTCRRDLVKAGALIAAAIDRLDAEEPTGGAAERSADQPEDGA